jgi:superfamily II DNA or RNA helicase
MVMTYKLFDINESYTELETEDIQFKRKVIDTLSVFEEGYQYTPAFRAGVWSGKREFFTIQPNKNIKFPKGLVQYVIKDLQDHNYQYSYNTTTQQTNITFEEFQDFVETLNLPFPPYDYQIKATFDIIRDRRGVQQAATGAGKSLLLYLVIMWMLKNNKKSILVVPTISLTLQMRGDFIDYGIEKHYNVDNVIKVIGGEFNNKDLKSHPLIISTWQSLQYLKEEEFSIFDSILCDEAHTIKGEVLSNIIKYATNAQWKAGVTGTIPRTRVDKLQLLGTLGRAYKVITPQGLIERGLATPVFINLLYINYSQTDREQVRKEKMKFPEEERFITQHLSRNSKVTLLMSKLTQKNGGENILTLFNKVDHGKLLLRQAIALKNPSIQFELLDKLTPKPLKEAIELWEINQEMRFYINQELQEPEFKKILKVAEKHLNKDDAQAFLKSIYSLTDLNIYFIYGGVEGSARDEIRKILEEKTGVQIIASYGTTSTGINYKNLHHLVLAASTKSFIRLSQTVGRGMRKHESKQGVHIWDIVDDLSYETPRTKKENYMLKHSYERIEIYREQEYPLSERELFIT